MHDDTRRLPPLELLGAFEAAARLRSFTKAAEERFLTQSAVSRQIAALEENLGVALFLRRHRALELTPDGQRLADAVRVALDALRGAVVEIRAPQRREVLALTTTPGLASLWLIPRLADFLSAHPGVDVRIDATLTRRQLAAEGFDIAIRYGNIATTSGRQLFEEVMCPVCAPALLQDPARPLQVPADLVHHTLLQIETPPGEGPPTEWQPWLSVLGLRELQPRATLTLNNFDAAIAAAVAGQGVVLGRRPIIDDLLKSGALVAPFEGETAPVRGYYLVIEPGARRKPAVQDLERWLLHQARQSDLRPLQPPT